MSLPKVSMRISLLFQVGTILIISTEDTYKKLINHIPLHFVIVATYTYPPFPLRTISIPLRDTYSWRAPEIFPLLHVILPKTNIV